MNEMESRLERLFQNDTSRLPNFDRMWERINPTRAKKRKAFIHKSIYFLITSFFIAFVVYGWDTEQGIEIRQKLASLIYTNELHNGNAETHMETLGQQLNDQLNIFRSPKNLNFILLLSRYLPEGAYIKSYVGPSADIWLILNTRGNELTSIFAVKYNGDSSEKLVQNLRQANVERLTISNHNFYYLSDANYHYLVWNQEMDGQIATFALGSNLKYGLTVDEMMMEVNAYLD